MDERGDLPFKAEYAKSGRASCKRCKDTIAKDSLRLAIMVQNNFANKMAPEWFHFHCFWFQTQYQTANELNELNMKGFNALRWEDQQKIKDMIAGGRENLDKIEIRGNYKEYAVEYAKSGRSGCRGTCNGSRIPMGAVRISKLDYDGEGAYLYGPQKQWHCLQCFAKMRKKLGFFADMDPVKIPGFDELKEEDQKAIIVKLKRAKKRKADKDATEGAPKAKKRKEKKKDKMLREQNELLWNTRDSLEKDVSEDVMKTLLEHNDQFVPKQKKNMLDVLSDCMVFGGYSACEVCGGRNYLFSEAESQYLCVGVKGDGKPCNIKIRNLTREIFKVPESCYDIDFLKNYKFVPRDRVYPEVSVNLTPLTGLSFVVGNRTRGPKRVIESQLESIGAKVVDKPQLRLSACISSKEEFASKNSPLIRACKALKIPIVCERFLNACKDGGDVSDIMKSFTFETE